MNMMGLDLLTIEFEYVGNIILSRDKSWGCQIEMSEN